MYNEINKKASDEILETILKQSGLPYHKIQEGEEGGIFYIDEKTGERKKFTENIFIKRSIKHEKMKQLIGEYDMGFVKALVTDSMVKENECYPLIGIYGDQMLFLVGNQECETSIFDKDFEIFIK